MENPTDIFVDDQFHVIVRRDEEIPIFGGVAYVIDGQTVGDLRQTCVLSVPLGHWKSYMATSRRVDRVRDMSAREAWNFCYNQLYGDVEYTQMGIPVEIDISSNYAECFDGLPVFLITDEFGERYIWSTDKGLTAGDCRLSVGTYQKTIIHVLSALRDVL